MAIRDTALGPLLRIRRHTAQSPPDKGQMDLRASMQGFSDAGTQGRKHATVHRLFVGPCTHGTCSYLGSRWILPEPKIQ